jgi:hypothetical protein
MYITEPEDIIQNFLRGYVAEVTRLDDAGDPIADRQTLQTETFNGNTVLTEFTMSNNTTCFYTVKISGTLQIPYFHYDIDYNNRKIRFISPPPTGTDNIEVKYYSGSNWIFTDQPRDDLSKLKYPRISVIKLTEPHTFKGTGTTETYLNTSFQIDILSFKDLICSIESENKEGYDVTRYISRKVLQAFKDDWKTQLGYKINLWDILANNPQVFNPDNNLFVSRIEMGIVYQN